MSFGAVTAHVFLSAAVRAPPGTELWKSDSPAKGIVLVKDNSGILGSTPATVTITRTGNTPGASTLKVKTRGGTATVGTNYTTLTLTPSPSPPTTPP